MKDLPGYEEANRFGYELRAYSGDRTSATYCKGLDDARSISLTVHADGQATLDAYVRMIHCRIGPISFPHKHFETLEGQLIVLVMVSRHYL